MSSPLIVAAAATQHTQRIRLGMAVSLLPLNNPIRSAEDGATVDILSHGRLVFGVGRGTNLLHYRGFNIPMEESRDRFTEALEIVTQAWTNDRVRYEGKYYPDQGCGGTPQTDGEISSSHPYRDQQLRYLSSAGAVRLSDVQ
jgi:alkanesulfonate monooxygenase SsuD/methylene tetrahydromethanopterin reductase-like flavin-dependent oxidoreductase (luciferase family)